MRKKLLTAFGILLLSVACLFGCSGNEDTTEEIEVEESASSLIQTMTTEELQTLFGEYDLTMVNIWATWCGPCVSEMPELAALYQELPENVTMLTVCTDSFDELQTAQQIIKECGAEFTTLHANADVRAYFLQDLTAFPTTLFVNSEGEFVGEPFIGANTSDAYMQEINARLGE